jgi:hypothetical protein
MSRLFRRISAVAAGLTAAATITLVAHAQTMGTPEHFTASAINMNRGAAGNIDIVVNRWSSDAERDKLIAVMLNKGPEKLLDALQDMPRMGYFRSGSSLGWDIHFARRAPNPDGGERVTLITDRRISFGEAVNQPRSIDYPFTVIELRLNRDGEGEGKMSIATKITVDKDSNMITLENYDIQPVMLTNVKSERVTHR